MKKSNHPTFAELIGINPRLPRGNTFAEMLGDARQAPAARVEGWKHRDRAGAHLDRATIDSQENRR